MSKLTLDEAIKLLEDRAFWKRDAVEMAEDDDGIGNEVALAEAEEDEQLAEWLRELKKAKQLLKMAVSIINNSFPEVGSCWGCANHDEVNDECKGGAFVECADVCKWQYADEAEKILNN